MLVCQFTWDDFFPIGFFQKVTPVDFNEYCKYVLEFAL